MKNRKRRDYLGILLLLVVGLSVGYALLRTNLTINGTSKIKGNTWDIHFENLNVTEGSVELSTEDSAAVIDTTTKTDITYTVTLNQPGDFYEFTVDAVNAGSIDGMVESITSKLNNNPITTLPAYLNYSVTYETGDSIEINHLLKAEESETYKVRIEFKKDISATDLPSTIQTLTLDFGVIYTQADSNGIEVKHPLNRIIYSVNKNQPYVTINAEYPETIPYFETPTEALSAVSYIPVYLKHKVENGIVTENYIEFVVTQDMAENNTGMVPGTYTLRGVKTYASGGNAGYIVDTNYISPYYESNKETLKTAFGYATNPSRCSESGTGRSSHFNCYCYDANLNANNDADGRVDVSKGNSNGCYMSRLGDSRCDW